MKKMFNTKLTAGEIKTLEIAGHGDKTAGIRRLIEIFKMIQSDINKQTKRVAKKAVRKIK